MAVPGERKQQGVLELKSTHTEKKLSVSEFMLYMKTTINDY